MDNQDFWKQFKKSSETPRSIPFDDDDWDALATRLDKTEPKKRFPFLIWLPWILAGGLLLTNGYLFQQWQQDTKTELTTTVLLDTVYQTIRDTVFIERIIETNTTFNSNNTQIYVPSTANDITYIDTETGTSLTLKLENPLFRQEENPLSILGQQQNMNRRRRQGLMGEKVENETPIKLGISNTELNAEKTLEQSTKIELKNVPTASRLKSLKQLEYLPEQYLILPQSISTSSAGGKSMKLQQIAQKLIPKSVLWGVQSLAGLSFETPIGRQFGVGYGGEIQVNFLDKFNLYGNIGAYENFIETNTIDSTQGIPLMDAPPDFFFTNAETDQRHLNFGIGLQYNITPHKNWSIFLRGGYQHSLILPYTISYNFRSAFPGTPATQVNRRIRPSLVIPKILEFSLGFTNFTNSNQIFMLDIYYRHPIESSEYQLPNRIGLRTGIFID